MPRPPYRRSLSVLVLGLTPRVLRVVEALAGLAERLAGLPRLVGVDPGRVADLVLGGLRRVLHLVEKTHCQVPFPSASRRFGRDLTEEACHPVPSGRIAPDR